MASDCHYHRHRFADDRQREISVRTAHNNFMVKLNKIYTKTGDDGTTGLVDGSRQSKAHSRMHAIGDVDEANSCLGVAICALEQAGGEPHLIAGLRRVQNDLFDLGADIATPQSGEGNGFAPSEMELRIIASQVDWLESAIDDANEKLPPLNSFILPGGSNAAASMHVARATVRRAERALVSASHHDAINPLAIQYLNRLSDYLFVLCRLINAVHNSDNGGDILWVPGGSR
jgi:cob(I)alamin adenosyltransferase